MAGEGAPTASTIDAAGVTVAIVHGQWHERVATGLLDGARNALQTMGASIVEVPVPGSFELPVVAQEVLRGDIDAVVALGVIIRGGTPHFEYVSQAATLGLTNAALETGKPIGFGVLTLDDEQQGLDRAGFADSKEDKGAEAAEAAVQAVLTMRSLGTSIS